MRDRLALDLTDVECSHNADDRKYVYTFTKLIKYALHVTSLQSGRVRVLAVASRSIFCGPSLYFW